MAGFNGDPTTLDTTWEVVTPESVLFRFRLAGPASRAFAFGFDFILQAAVLMIGARALSFLGPFGWGLYLITLFLVQWAYFVFFEIKLNGQSPGKKLLGLRVTGENGTPLTWQQSLVRNVLRAADQIPVSYALGGIVMLLTKRSQRLGDLAAGTIVVVEDENRLPQVSGLPTEPTDSLLRQLPPGLPIDPELQRAALLYVTKRDGLSAALRRELTQPVVQWLIARAGLPAETDPDHVMCAYYRFAFPQETTSNGSSGD